MNNTTIENLSEFQNISIKHKSVCFYLSTPECSICKALKPKVIEMLADDFPLIHFCYVDLN